MITPKATTPVTTKTLVTPRYTTTIEIELLSPGIDSSSSMSRPSKSVTPERIPHHKNNYRYQKNHKI